VCASGSVIPGGWSGAMSGAGTGTGTDIPIIDVCVETIPSVDLIRLLLVVDWRRGEDEMEMEDEDMVERVMSWMGLGLDVIS
jgi:hypothetical protein